MLTRRFYYSLKPYVPWRVRMALRRMSARQKRKEFRHSWPIDEAAGRAPEGWPGWPEQRRFAFVLTHDVEGAAGLDKCWPLARLEQQLGFRSCFNFIPEGEYVAPPDLRRSLVQSGFEVGVHDLEHDGKLFNSRRDFCKKSARINRYLKEWEAAGFRAGFMLRNLEWLHELDIRYDSSTFDTDPFEPQSEGAGTIFPFWIPGWRRDGGYVELPYTLPQDSTLFLVLQQTAPEIWLSKLDWIARHGGMALVDVHSDYLCFDGRPGPRTYPVTNYIKFLEHVRERYAGCYWHALPRDVARYVSGLPCLRRPPRARRICMITHSFYENDNRVMRYAETLAGRGDAIDVLALRRSPTLPAQENIQGVSVHRIQYRLGKTERTRLAYLWSMARFLVASSWWVTRKHRRRPYDLLHVHSMPDFLVFAGWYPRLTGTRVILDMHDFLPELYAAKFQGRGQRSMALSLLCLMERWAARFADHVILANDLWLDKYSSRTRSTGKCSVFINHVDTRIFQPQPRTRRDDKIIILFPGSLHWHQGLDIALRAFSRVACEVPNAEFHIYGEGDTKPTLVELAANLGLNGRVRFFEPVGVKQIAGIMANADVGVVPKRADSFGDVAYSTKIMEFMAVGIPVVVSRTTIDQYYFDESLVRFFPSGDDEALAAALLEVIRDGALRRKITENASLYARQNSWGQQKLRYLDIVDTLVEGLLPNCSDRARTLSARPVGERTTENAAR